jgi:heme oxygenase
VAPLERSLADTAGIDQAIDVRRLRKHLLLEHDLQALGVKDLRTVSQCMSVPWFDSIPTALGWMFFSERSTLAHPHLYRHLAQAIPGDVAFASSYLKCYFGNAGEMWRTFGDDLEVAVKTRAAEDQVLEAAKAAFRHYRRWGSTMEGKALSGMHAIPGAEESRE